MAEAARHDDSLFFALGRARCQSNRLARYRRRASSDERRLGAFVGLEHHDLVLVSKTRDDATIAKRDERRRRSGQRSDGDLFARAQIDRVHRRVVFVGDVREAAVTGFGEDDAIASSRLSRRRMTRMKTAATSERWRHGHGARALRTCALRTARRSDVRGCGGAGRCQCRGTQHQKKGTSERHGGLRRIVVSPLRRTVTAPRTCAFAGVQPMFQQPRVRPEVASVGC